MKLKGNKAISVIAVVFLVHFVNSIRPKMEFKGLFLKKLDSMIKAAFVKDVRKDRILDYLIRKNKGKEI